MIHAIITDVLALSAAVVLIMTVTQLIKKFVERWQITCDRDSRRCKASVILAHGWGARIIAVCTSMLVMLPDLVGDGLLSSCELDEVLEALGVPGAARVALVAALAMAAKSSARRLAWTKGEHQRQKDQED
jgi:hypothetical protein